MKAINGKVSLQECTRGAGHRILSASKKLAPYPSQYERRENTPNTLKKHLCQLYISKYKLGYVKRGSTAFKV